MTVVYEQPTILITQDGISGNRANAFIDEMNAGVAATAADRVQTGLDRAVTAADRVQTGLDRAVTAADRVQTGLDRAVTAADRVQTGLDRAVTAADRVQTGLDRSASAASAAQAALYDGPRFDDFAAVVADTVLSYTVGAGKTVVVVGSYVLTSKGGFAYQVAASGATDHHVTTAGGVQLYVQSSGGRVDASAFGAIGDDVSDDTAAIKTMLASGFCRFYFGKNKTYRVSLVEGTFLGKFIGGDIEILGENVTIHDVSTGYTNNGAFTQIFWVQATSSFSCSGVNYLGPILATPNTLLGYQGATFVRATHGAKNIHVVANVENARYGIHSGDYNLWDYGYCDGFTGRITGAMIGYPMALYLASNINVDINCNGHHRLAYFAGCYTVHGDIRGRDQYIAPIFVILSDAKTSAGTARGCKNYHAKVTDTGSTVYLAESRLIGISPSWDLAGITYDDIDLNATIVSSDTVASTIGHAAIYSPSISWNNTKMTNIRVSGLLDRSGQTIAEQATAGEIYISIAGVPIENFDMSDFVYKPGSGAKPRGFWFLMDTLSNGALVRNVNFGDAPVRWGTNATSLTKFENVKLLGSFAGGSDSPYLSRIEFDNCTITQASDQPAANKRYINTLAHGGGATVERLMTELTLTGGSVTWANSLPNHAAIIGVTGRVTEAITGASGFQVGISGALTKYYDSATGALGVTFGPGNHTDPSPRYQSGTGSIIVTAKTANFTGGKLRLLVDFIRVTPPTS